MPSTSGGLPVVALVGRPNVGKSTLFNRIVGEQAAIVEDRHGVIAPWYGGQNGQCDFRVRVSAETLKRYPWADKPKAAFVKAAAWLAEPPAPAGNG